MTTFIKLLWSKYNIGIEIPVKLKSQRKRSVQNQRNYALIKNAKSLCLKWPYRRLGIDYRVDSLFTRYLTAIGIIPESLKSIGQF